MWSFPTGFRVFRGETANQQAHIGTLHGKPRTLHEEEETGLHWSAADEGSTKRRKNTKRNGQVIFQLNRIILAVFLDTETPMFIKYLVAWT